MNSKVYMYCFAALTMLISATLLDSTVTLKYSGSAIDLHSKKFYYTEEHEEIMTAGVHTSTKIVYKDPAGVIIVRKTIDFSKGQTHPSFLQEDVRDGYTEGAQIISADKVKLTYRKNNQTELETAIITIPSPVVVDGGFNYFIKNNWLQVLEGKTVKFNFAVPSQLDYYAFRVKKEKNVVYNGKNAVIIQMEADDFFIRQLVDPVILTYETQTMRLMKYEGLSNINDSKGKSYQVQLTYPTVGP